MLSSVMGSPLIRTATPKDARYTTGRELMASIYGENA